MKLDFEEIEDGTHFENLVAAYFNELKKDKNSNLFNVKINQSGVGTDGGRDILVVFDLYDAVVDFKRKWVVQCKFHESNISPSEINSINIPSLIHSYKAEGYLLICKRNPTSGTTDLFERLNKECKFNYHYECWTGNLFLNKLGTMESLHPQFFPKYHDFITSKRKKL
jgi:predicted helicase